MFFILCIYSIGINAQTINVTGLVTDTRNEPLIGVTLKVIGDSEKGTVTDFDGKFTMSNIPSNAQIEVSYVGMQKQVIDVRGRTTINIVLNDDTELLDEVVIVAYGVQKKVSVTGAISTVSTKDLRVSTSPSLANALSGRIAGLTS
ncbi:MAG: carboxypeptidase-like regulatory domain-containing protein, partial [Sphaerochaeta sp.]